MLDLLDEPTNGDVPLLGQIDQTGVVSSLAETDEKRLSVSVPASHPVAARLTRNLGSFREGEVLIGNRLPSAHMSQGFDRICLVGVKEGLILLARLLPCSVKGARFALVPLQSGEDTRYVQKIDWCAPIVMAVRFF